MDDRGSLNYILGVIIVIFIAIPVGIIVYNALKQSASQIPGAQESFEEYESTLKEIGYGIALLGLGGGSIAIYVFFIRKE